MKKTYSILLALFLIVWPQHKSAARKENKPAIESLINYQLVKAEVLNYQIEKSAEKAEKRIDSIKNK